MCFQLLHVPVMIWRKCHSFIMLFSSYLINKVYLVLGIVDYIITSFLHKQTEPKHLYCYLRQDAEALFGVQMIPD